MSSQTEGNPTGRISVKRHLIFFIVIGVLVAAAIFRSAITTSLDSFTFDEAYQIRNPGVQ